jgi:hypothetical protein
MEANRRAAIGVSEIDSLDIARLCDSSTRILAWFVDGSTPIQQVGDEHTGGSVFMWLEAAPMVVIAGNP